MPLKMALWLEYFWFALSRSDFCTFLFIHSLMPCDRIVMFYACLQRVFMPDLHQRSQSSLWFRHIVIGFERAPVFLVSFLFKKNLIIYISFNDILQVSCTVDFTKNSEARQSAESRVINFSLGTLCADYSSTEEKSWQADRRFLSASCSVDV